MRLSNSCGSNIVSFSRSVRRNGQTHGRAATSADVRMLIGDILINNGVLDKNDIADILNYQSNQGVRFCEAAMQLKRLGREEVDHALAQQYCAICLKDEQRKLEKELLIMCQPKGRGIDSLRMLRSILMRRWFNGTPKSLAVISANDRDARSFLVANLAILFSQLDCKTLLIDADMRNPRQQGLFHIDTHLGLSSFLADHNQSRIIHRIETLSNLMVMPAGPQPSNPLELLGRNRFGAMLQTLYKRFSVILIDTPISNAHADALLVARECGAAVLLADAQHSSRVEARAVSKRLARAGVEVLGTVINRH